MVGLYKAFGHVDWVDIVLMLVGCICSLGDGLAYPATLIVKGNLINNLGIIIYGHLSNPDIVINNLNKNALIMCEVAAAGWIFAFLEGYCWTRTAERQTARMRARYMKVVLRQDVSYFEMSQNSVSEVVTSVSSDTLLIQECIGEKRERERESLMNVSMFIGCYVAAFILLWRLAIMAIPFLVLLVVPGPPGIMYGRVLISVTRKMRREYDKAGSIAEKAISSIRTVYAFVGESKAVSTFSEALQGLVRLGLTQGLAEGLAMGTNGLTFATWSFNSWYATKLVMYHGAKGGTAFVTGVCTTNGGL